MCLFWKRGCVWSCGKQLVSQTVVARWPYLECVMKQRWAVLRQGGEFCRLPWTSTRCCQRLSPPVLCGHENAFWICNLVLSLHHLNCLLWASTTNAAVLQQGLPASLKRLRGMKCSSCLTVCCHFPEVPCMLWKRYRAKKGEEEENNNKPLLLQNFLIASFSDLNADLTLLELPLYNSSK